MKTHEQYVNELKNIEPNINVIGVYSGALANIDVECLLCGYKWHPPAGNLINRKKPSKCPNCHSRTKESYDKAIVNTHPDMVKWLYDKVDGERISAHSNKKTNWKCPTCGNIVKSSISHVISRNHVPCRRCSDGISYPEKYMYSLLKQLNLDFKTEYSPNWIKPKRYNFYIPSNELIIEMDEMLGHGNKSFDKCYYDSANELLAEKSQTIRDNIEVGSYDTKYISLKSKLKQFDNIKSATDEIIALDNAYNKLIKESKSDDDLVSNMKAFEKATSKANNTLKQLTITGSKIDDFKNIQLSNQIEIWIKKNTRLTKEFIEVAQQMKSELANATEFEYKQIENRFKNLKNSAEIKGLIGKSPLDEIKRGFKQIFQFVGTYGIYQRMFDIFGQAIQNVVEMDSAMTNLKKVTDESSISYAKFLNGAGKTAKDIGRDISSYIEQVSEWSKLGYSMNSSSELAKVSSIYANVGEVDDKTAVSDLVTVMKAYNIQDSQAINIVDKLNELGNNYATDAASLGDGLKNMASTMSMAGVNLDKSLAILTGGTEITQDAGELGNAIKVAVLRMRGQKGQLEELGENADDIESVSKMQTQILNMTKGAVNIMESADPTAFRDYYDVMADIAEVLPKLNETEQANLIETLFGKQRANQGQAILQAFQSGQIQKALESSINSEGSALEEQNKWLDSIEAKLQQTESQFQELSNTILSSDLIKGTLDVSNGLLGFLTKIIDSFGTLNTLILGLSTYKFIRSGKPYRFHLLHECATGQFSREVYELYVNI